MSTEYTDQMGRSVKVPSKPRRIVSVVPSQTEYLFDLGLTDEVIGITKFCIHPKEWFRSKTRIGGTKDLKIDRILELDPDLIIANKEENEESQILRLAEHVPTWISDIHNLDEAYDMMNQVGIITGMQPQAKRLVSSIKDNFAQLETVHRNKTVAYLIWKDPYMAAGANTFIDHMLSLIDLTNVFHQEGRYPEVGLNDLIAKQPDYIFLSSEPYPFKEKHVLELQDKLPNSTVLTVDGELFSWYGSRLLKTPSYLNQLITQANHKNTMG